MTDVLTPEQRRLNMSRIRGKDTKPEIQVRRVLHRLGYRFRLHRRDLPGSPDIVLPRLRTVIFVHGCYWHRHDCRYGQVRPSTRREFWQAKFDANVERDARNQCTLENMGWRVVTIWECMTKDTDTLADLLVATLSPS